MWIDKKLGVYNMDAVFEKLGVYELFSIFFAGSVISYSSIMFNDRYFHFDVFLSTNGLNNIFYLF